MPKDKKNRKFAHFDSLLVHECVADFMSSPPLTVTREKSMAEAKALMRDHRVSGLPVVDEEGKLIGLISIENIIMALEENFIGEQVGEHMATSVLYFRDDMDVSTVMEYLMNYHFGRYPVVDRDNRVVGVVTKGDLMLHLYARLGNIYMHNKRRDDLLMPSACIDDTVVKDDHFFQYEIDTDDLDQAGIGATQIKRFLKERGFPPEETRRASIALYEAEVNVVLHAGGKGYIKAYLKDDKLFMVVADHGPGIDDIEKAMKPGYTTAPDHVRERGFGAGMGLDNIQRYTDKLIILSTHAGVKIEMVIIPKNGKKGDAKKREDVSN